MSLAARTREAVMARPFLHDALRAGVVNYTAAARTLAVGDGETEAVAAALRRYAEDLPGPGAARRDARVSMESGLGLEDGDGDRDALVAVAGAALVPGAGSLTGVLATGDVDADALGHALNRLRVAGTDVEAAGVAGDAMLVAVGRRDGPDALRTVEDALGSVPSGGDDPG